MAVSLVLGRDVEDWLGPAEVEANQKSTLSTGDMVWINALMDVDLGCLFAFTIGNVPWVNVSMK